MYITVNMDIVYRYNMTQSLVRYTYTIVEKTYCKSMMLLFRGYVLFPMKNRYQVILHFIYNKYYKYNVNEYMYCKYMLI